MSNNRHWLVTWGDDVTVGLSAPLQAGCCASTDGCSPPRTSIQGRLVKRTGNCGILPPGGDCPTPVRYDPFPGGHVLIYTADGEHPLANLITNSEARFAVALSPGDYLVIPDNTMRLGHIVTVPPVGYVESEVEDYIPPP